MFVWINGKAIVGNLAGAKRHSGRICRRPAGPGYDVWREDVCRNFCRIDAEPSTGGQIFCKVEIVKVSSLALATSGGTSGRFLRSRALLSNSCDDFILFGATSGGLEVIREGRATELLQSQMWLTDLTAESAVTFHDGNQFQSIQIPRRELLSICPGAESKLAAPLLTGLGIREMIARYFALSTETAASKDAIGQLLTARHMIDLVALLLRTGPDETRLRGFRREGIPKRVFSSSRLHVLDRLNNNGLAIASVARRFGSSSKLVQRLFERAGMTFTEFVLEQRLLLARRLLSGLESRQNEDRHDCLCGRVW